jgi:uncharacterized protein (TIGR03083 family)
MPTSLTLDDHLAALDEAGSRLVELAEKAGLEAPVPTCPAWTAHALLAHQAMVHRWAAANVRGDDANAVPNQTEIRTTVEDLPAYYREGHAALLAALRAAPADLAAPTFLNDAPPPREFWARRQAHETTIHMVDALAAALGRLPTADEVDVDVSLAADGIDELLRGFFTRGRSKLFEGEEYAFAVEATDADRRWVVRVAERLRVDPDDAAAGTDDIAARINGSAAELYLGLWNRGDAFQVAGPGELLDRWRANQRVSWS